MRPSRLLLALPPLLIAGAVAYVLLRGAGSTERRRAEGEIRARWAAPAERAAVEADALRYLARYGGDPEARWFAAEALARVGAHARAFHVVLREGPTATLPDAPRRLASLLLRHVGVGTGLGARALLVRAEAGEADARAELHEVVAAMRAEPDPPPALLPFYKAASLAGGPARDLLARELRARPDAQIRLAGATLATGPRDRADVELLLAHLGEDFRRERRWTWRNVVKALGASGDPRAREALRAAAAAERGDREDRLVPRVGLALLDEPGEPEAVLAALAGARSDRDGSLYASGLATRLRQGDVGAAPRMVALWDANPGPLTRLTLAYEVLFEEAPPPPEVPAAEWHRDLLSSALPVAPAVHAAYEWRTGAPGSRERVLDVLERALGDPATYEPLADGSGGSPASVVEILRALVRWPPSAESDRG